MRNWGVGNERARRCISIAAVCPRFTPGVAVLARRFSLGICPTLRFCRGGLPSVRARRCDSVAAVCPRCASGVAVLARRSALGLRPALRFWRGGLASVHARRCISIAAVCPRRMPGVAVLARRLPSVHACCLPHGAKQDGLRYLAFLFRRSRSPLVRSRSVLRLSAFAGSLRVCTFLYGDLDGVPRTLGTENGERRTGLAARPLCAFARARWLCCAFRGEYAGAARPRLRQRVFDSLDSLHAAAGLCWYVFTAFVRLCAIALALRIFPRGVRWG